MSITVKEVINLYLKNLDARVADDAYSADHAKWARLQLNAFAARFGHQMIAQCKQHNLSTWLDEHPTWKSVETRRHVASTITGCFNWALEEQLIERSPYKRPSSLRGKAVPIRRPATQNEYVQLMRNGSRPLRRALYFLRRTGARTCEMRELTWDEVFLDGPSPHIALTRHKTFRQSGKPRIIGLDPSTVRFLRNLAKQYERRCNCDCEVCCCDIAPNVFTNCRGEPWNRYTFARHFRRCAKAIGLDEGVTKRVSAYCLRHFFTINAIESGISTRAIADQLGQAKTGIIDSVYGSHTRQRVEHIVNVAEQINRKRNKQPPTHGEQPKDGKS